jgi:hypothetical protein
VGEQTALYPPAVWTASNELALMAEVAGFASCQMLTSPPHGGLTCRAVLFGAHLISVE